LAIKIGYPAWTLNDGALNAYYSKLTLEHDDDPFTTVNKVHCTVLLDLP